MSFPTWKPRRNLCGSFRRVKSAATRFAILHAYRDLGATMVVQGSVQRKGPVVYLTVVLIDSKRMRQIGSVQAQ